MKKAGTWFAATIATASIWHGAAAFGAGTTTGTGIGSTFPTSTVTTTRPPSTTTRPPSTTTRPPTTVTTRPPSTTMRPPTTIMTTRPPTTTRPPSTTMATQTKQTSFVIHMRAYIEGGGINCTNFANAMKGSFLFSPTQWSMAYAFCMATKGSFPETSATTPARLNETGSIQVVCQKVGNGPWTIKSSTAPKPSCTMGTEAIGPASGGLVVGTGVLGNCISNASGSTFNMFIDGQPPMHMDLGLQIVKNRACTAIRIGISGSFACRADGVATMTAQTEGTNFPSLYWSISRIKPDGSADSQNKNQSQVMLENLWQCNGGNMASGTKGQITFN